MRVSVGGESNSAGAHKPCVMSCCPLLLAILGPPNEKQCEASTLSTKSYV